MIELALPAEEDAARKTPRHHMKFKNLAHFDLPIARFLTPFRDLPSCHILALHLAIVKARVTHSS